LHPVLEWRQKGGKSVVYDSRDGNAVEHELDANAVQLLAGLARARSLHDIQTNFATFDAAAELANLQAKGLVFEEDGRYLSLVIEEAREQAAESVVIEHLASESPGQGLLRVLS
jgi:hypothetical protein